MKDGTIGHRILFVSLLAALIPAISISYKFAVGCIQLSKDIPTHCAKYFLSSDLASIWIGVAGIHGAIGAIAPVLGYTILSVAVSPSARIAPPSSVISSETRWQSYLEASLGLLIGSVIGLLALPSIAGLVAAAIATWYVIFRTYLVFRDGFDLARDELKFDDAARRFLLEELRKVKTTSKDFGNVQPEIDVFNKWLRSLPSARNEQDREFLSLTVGMDGSALCELTTVSSSLCSRIDEIVRDSSVALYRTSETLPISLRRPREILLICKSLAPKQDDNAVKQSLSIAREKIQKTLNSAAVYMRGEWSSSQARVPMLMTRYLESAIYDSFARSTLGDLRYGLDVLGHLVDEVVLQNPDLIGSEAHSWVFDIPDGVVSRLAGLPGDSRFPTHVVSFVRSRLALSLKSPSSSQVSGQYLRYLTRMIAQSSSTQKTFSTVSLHVREMPFLLSSPSPLALTEIGRCIIVSLFEDDVLTQDASGAALRIVKLLRDTQRSARILKDASTSFQLESEISLIGVACLAREILQRNELISIALAPSDLRDSHRYDARAIMDVAANIDGLSSRWRWEWLEMDLKGEGTHFVSIHHWLLLGCCCLLAKSQYMLAFLKDDELPSLMVIQRLRRTISECGDLDFLSGIKSETVQLDKRLHQLEERRTQQQAAAIQSAHINIHKCSEFVDRCMTSLTDVHAPFAFWLDRAARKPQLEREPDQGFVGSSILIGKDSFVDDEVLDVSVMTMEPNFGSTARDYEVEQIIEALSSGQTQTVSSLDNIELWRAVGAQFDNHDAISIFALNIGEYELRQKAVEHLGTTLEGRIFTTYSSSRASARMVVCDVSSALEVARGVPPLPEGESLAHRFTSPENGGVHVILSTIPEEDLTRWAAEESSSASASEREQKYRQSLALSVRWSVKFTNLDGPRLVFEVSDSD